MAWFTYIAGLDFKLTKKMERFITLSKSNIGEVREGTIGDYEL